MLSERERERERESVLRLSNGVCFGFLSGLAGSRVMAKEKEAAVVALG